MRPPRPAAGTAGPGLLRSSSGAFDLPSVLIGVAVVAILAIGVMAAIFGVIPWTQDNAAKQDLAAVYTAQGSTYARDDQTFKDLSGLEAAGLISGIDPDATQVTVTSDGKGFKASITSDSGKRWCIAHDSNTPRECPDPSTSRSWSTDGWASERCSPAFVGYYEVALVGLEHPGYFEMAKSDRGEPHDAGALDAWMDYAVNVEAKVAGSLSSQDHMTIQESHETTPIYEMLMEVMDPDDWQDIPAAQAELGSKVAAELVKFCHP